MKIKAKSEKIYKKRFNGRCPKCKRRFFSYSEKSIKYLRESGECPICWRIGIKS